MGRKKIQIDPAKIYEMTAQGMTQLDMAKELGVCHVTLSRRMADLRKKTGLLVDYRSIQALHLTALQARVLESITPEKIAAAPLLELVKAFGILKKAEIVINPPQIKGGLEYYLMQLERVDADKVNRSENGKPKTGEKNDQEK